MGRAFKVFFTASVVLNVFLVGVVGTHVIMRHTPWMDMRQNMSPETKEKMRELFKGNKAQRQEERRRVHDRVKAVQDILSAQVFDRQSYERAWSTLIEERMQMMERRMTQFGDIAEGLAQEDRAAIAAHLVPRTMKIKHMKKNHKNKNRERDRVTNKE